MNKPPRGLQGPDLGYIHIAPAWGLREQAMTFLNPAKSPRHHRLTFSP